MSSRKAAKSNQRRRLENASANTELTKGFKGVLVTYVRGKDGQVRREMEALLNSAADRLFPAPITEGAEGEEQGGEDEAAPDFSSVGDELEQELLAIRAVEKAAAGARRKRPHPDKTSRSRFVMVPGCVPDCYMLFQIRDVPGSEIEPVRLVLSVMERLLSTGERSTRATLRACPIQSSCASDMEAITALAQAMIEQGVAALPDNASVGVEMNRAGQNDKIDRDTIVRSLLAMVPRRLRTELKGPDCTIVLNVMGSFSTLAVCPRYAALKRYNFDSVLQQSLSAASASTPLLLAPPASTAASAPTSIAASAAPAASAQTIASESHGSETAAVTNEPVGTVEAVNTVPPPTASDDAAAGAPSADSGLAAAAPAVS